MVSPRAKFVERIAKMKNTFKFGISLAAIAALAACSAAEDAPAEEALADDGHGEESAWGYGEDNGPAHWGDLSEEYALCSAGLEQSPIDIAAGNAASVEVSGTYGAAPAQITDNGHTIQATFGEGFSLTSGENSYNLLQFHLHTPSENTIDGEAFPLVAHLVHADADSNLAVLGVMFAEGEANAQIQTLLDNLEGEAEVDVAAMLPEDMTVYNFAGSLTTPPCSEGVNWHVLTNPVSASAEQIAALTEIMGNNARPVQPLNDRVLAAAE